MGFITDTDLLKENSPDFTDALGPENIWARITKAGEDKFYRVKYKPTDNTEFLKRICEKQYVEGKGLERLINTNVAKTPYIQHVIKAYVEGDKESEKQLYYEPHKQEV